MSAIYSAIFLTPESRTTLLEAVKPIYSNVFCDHVTLKFKPTAAELQGLQIGKKVGILVIASPHDDDIQAVSVALPGHVKCYNRHPHITISARPGVAPKRSNDLNFSGAWAISPFTIEGIIGVREG